MKQWLAKLIAALCGLTCLAVLSAVGAEALHTWRERETAAERTARIEQRLQDLKAQQAQRQAYQERYFNDPAFFETIVRDKLGYVKPNEEVYYFGDAE